MTARVLEHPKRQRLLELEDARRAGELAKRQDEIKRIEMRLRRLARRIDLLLEDHGIEPTSGGKRRWQTRT